MVWQQIERMSDVVVINYEDIVLGYVVEFFRIVTWEDGLAFSVLSGNKNPLHCNRAFGAQSSFGDAIAYGMLVGSFFSTLVGMYCPGRDSVCLRQSLEYRHPVFYGDKLCIRGTVLHKHDSLRAITLRTEAWRDDKLVVSGEVLVSWIS